MHLMGAEDYYRFPEMAEQVRAKHGLDRPLVEQAWTYMAGILRGDLGVSFRYRSDVGELLLRGIKWTACLVLPSLAVGSLLAALLGGVAGWCQGRPWERLLTMSIMLFRSVPEYGIAMIALFLLAYHLALFPLAGIAQVGRPGDPATRSAALDHPEFPLYRSVLSGPAERHRGYASKTVHS